MLTATVRKDKIKDDTFECSAFYDENRNLKNNDHENDLLKKS